MASSWGSSWGLSWLNSWGTIPSGGEEGTPIVNANAQTSAHSGYEICPISGFKQYPTNSPFSKMRRRWDGEVVRLKSLDKRHPQEFIESRSERQRGSDSPEPDDLEYTSITPDDL